MCTPINHFRLIDALHFSFTDSGSFVWCALVRVQFSVRQLDQATATNYNSSKRNNHIGNCVCMHKCDRVRMTDNRNAHNDLHFTSKSNEWIGFFLSYFCARWIAFAKLIEFREVFVFGLPIFIVSGDLIDERSFTFNDRVSSSALFSIRFRLSRYRCRRKIIFLRYQNKLSFVCLSQSQQWTLICERIKWNFSVFELSINCCYAHKVVSERSEEASGSL